MATKRPTEPKHRVLPPTTTTPKSRMMGLLVVDVLAARPVPGAETKKVAKKERASG